MLAAEKLGEFKTKKQLFVVPLTFVLVTSKLLDHGKTSEKLYLIDDHIACVVSGITADANILVNTARVAAQRHLYSYNEPMPVEQLVWLCSSRERGVVLMLIDCVK